MPKIKAGTATRAQDMLGRKVKVGDTIKDTRNGKVYHVVSTMSAKSTSDSEVLDLAKKAGSLLAFFQTTKAWNDSSEGDQDAAARVAEMPAAYGSAQEADDLRKQLEAEQAKYASLLTSFDHCKSELEQMMEALEAEVALNTTLALDRDSIKAVLDETSALNAKLMSENEALESELSGAQKSNEGLADANEVLKAHNERLMKDLETTVAECRSIEKDLERAMDGKYAEMSSASLMGATCGDLLEELKRRGVRGELSVPQTVWTKYSLDDEAAGK